MARFKNFSIWRKRLPHWRADGETYYTYSKFRRELSDSERERLFAEVLRIDGNKANIEALAVVADRFEALISMIPDVSGKELDVQKLIEGAMRRTAKAIQKKTGEKFSPFFDEPFDRIVRDDGERQEMLEGMLNRVCELMGDFPIEDCLTLYMPSMPTSELN